MPKRRSDELAAIDEVMPLVDRFHELEHAQRLVFLDMVDPLPEETAQGKKSQKKASKTAPRKIQHCAVCDWTKRAALHKQRGTLDDNDDGNRFDGKSAQETRRELLQDIDDEDSYCTHQYEHDGIMIECGEPADQNIHHLSTTEGYHPFVSESGAPPAPASSPANGGAESGAVSSEIAKDAASSVHHAGG